MVVKIVTYVEVVFGVIEACPKLSHEGDKVVTAAVKDVGDDGLHLIGNVGGYLCLRP